MGAVWARIVNSPIHRGERSEREGRGVSARVLRVKQHLVPEGQLHVPPVGVKRRLVSVLLLLEQRQHLRRVVRHQVSSGLAGDGGGGRVWRIGLGEGPALVLTTVGVERRVA